MTVTAVSRIGPMTRWQPNARGRLRQAALELYGEHGFDQTTVAQIAQRAGLTERTFYRHFSDKREVVFAGEVHRVLVTTVAAAPAPMSAIEAVTEALPAAGRPSSPPTRPCSSTSRSSTRRSSPISRRPCASAGSSPPAPAWLPRPA